MSSGIETRVDRIESLLERVTQMQSASQQQIDENNQSLARLEARVDEFVFQAQRLFNQGAEWLNRLEPQAERADAMIARLDRNYEAHQRELAQFRIITNAALERIDRVLDYLWTI